MVHPSGETKYLEIKEVVKGGSVKAQATGNPFMPQGVFRALIVGRSGSGKSQLVANMILRGWLTFDRIVLCLKAPDQEVYEALAENIQEIAEDNELEAEDLLKIVTSVEQLQDVLPLEEKANRSVKTLVIFDDFVTEGRKDNDSIGKYFSRGRHKNISCIYITQDFYLVPLIVRRNCNYFFLFGKINDTDLGLLHKSVSSGLKLDEFKRMYHEATHEKYNFLMIDTDTNLEPLRYRRNFDTVYVRQ